MLAPVHRLLLPCLNHLETTRDYGISSRQQLDQPGVQQCQLHTQPDAKMPSLPQVSQLTAEQKQELKQAVMGR